MSRLPPLPRLDWKNASTPVSADIGDVYFSGDGLSETRAVFLQGCGLPERWSGRAVFTVGELGFGSGLNLLALWDLWRRHRPSSNARLNFLTFEGALMSAKDAARVHSASPTLSEMSKILLENWPRRARGVQRIHLPDNLSLTIHVDEITAALPQASARVDAWFLDGFAPAKNPDMWSEDAMGHVARLSVPGAIAATYTVAGSVRRGLQDAGFQVEKKPGHGAKRERLEAVYSGCPIPPPATPHRVAIIGAGIAGACAARSFLNRGCAVTVIEAGPGPGSAASGNPIALVMPRLDASDTPTARGLIAAYLFALHSYGQLAADAAVPTPTRQLARNDRDQARFIKLLADPPLPSDLLQQAAGTTELNFPLALAIRPSIALTALLSGAKMEYNSTVTRLREDTDGLTLERLDGSSSQFDFIVVCAGHAMTQLLGEQCPPLEPRLGQIEFATIAPSPPRAIADGGYVVESFGDLVFGATFEPADGLPIVKPESRIENLATLARLRPGLSLSDLEPLLTSRAGIRATTQDRLPFAGPLVGDHGSDGSRVSILGGLGSRGFLWAPLLAELIVSSAFGEPLPIEASVAETVSPDRFRKRAIRRSR